MPSAGNQPPVDVDAAASLGDVEPKGAGPVLLGPGDSGPEVTKLQELLKKLDADVDATGVYDIKTQNAVALAQKTTGMDPTGLVDADTQALLAAMLRKFEQELEAATLAEARPDWDSNTVMARDKDGNIEIDHWASARENLGWAGAEAVIGPLASTTVIGGGAALLGGLQGAMFGSLMDWGAMSPVGVPALGIVAGFGLIPSLVDLVHAGVHAVKASLGFGLQADD
jgi:hypothetical protein